MSKVLISFLGTGALKQDDSSLRKYKQAKYRFDDNNEYESSFVSEALVQHFDIDKIILVGTVKSMWEEVYMAFAALNGIEPDEDYALKLMAHSESASAKSELALPEKHKIEEVLGQDSHIELIRYGLTKEEIEENEALILSLEQYINKGDELIVDITHSFRSLPLFLMNLLLYLANVSSKKITISHICYGMLEVRNELGYAPIVELNSIIEINKWITGAYAFSMFGNGYQIADLIQEENPSTSNIIKVFSDEMNLNHLDGVRSQTQRLSTIKNYKYSPIPSCIIPPTVNGFIENFPTDSKKSVFLFKVATWHYEHKNYSSSFISLLEAVLSYVCDTLNLPSETSDDMELAKVILGKKATIDGLTKNDIISLQKKIPFIDQLTDCYSCINKIRNGLAHQSKIKIKRKKQKTGETENLSINGEGMIKVLKEELDNMKAIIK